MDIDEPMVNPTVSDDPIMGDDNELGSNLSVPSDLEKYFS